MRGDAEDADAAGGVLDDGQDVHALAGQGHRLEEVGGEDGLGLGAQEGCPALSGPVGCRVDAGLVEDLPDGGRGDLDAQDEEFPVDAAVSPSTVLRARRSTSTRTDWTVRGRPTRIGREIRA